MPTQREKLLKLMPKLPNNLSDDNVWTTAEYSEAHGITKPASLKRLKQLLSAGVIKTSKTTRANVFGSMQILGGWEITDEK